MLVLQGGRRGRAAGGVRRRLQRDPRRRARDQRAAVAVPDRAQPLAEPPAPRAGGRRGLDGRAPLRGRADDRRQGAQARGVPAADRRRAGPAGDAAHRAAAARDRRAVLRADRRGDGDHRAVGEVAARARAGVARRGRRGAAAVLRRGARRARRGGRGPDAHDARRCAATCAPASAAPPSASSCARPTTARSPALFPVGPLFLLKKTLLAQLGTTAAAGGGAAAARRRRRPPPAPPPAARCRRA